MVDLDTGEGSTLIPLAESGRFITRRALIDPEGPSGPSEATEHIELRPGPEGPELHWLRPDGRELTGRRTELLEQERIRFRSGPLELAGTVLLPAGRGPHPAVVHVHGSGPIYRTALFQRAVLYAEMGVASLIYDKRGTGASEGRWSDDVFDDLAADARAALDALRAHPRIDPARVGYAGHSQAGYVIPMAAVQAPRPAFAVIVNGGSIRPGDQSLYDKENDLRRAGFSPDDREQALDLMRRLYDYVEHRTGDRAELERDYLAAREREWFPVTDLPDIPAIPSWDDPPEELFRYRDEIAFDPVPYQERMGMPVLVLLGADDETVPAHRAAETWEESLHRAESRSFRIEIVDGADHAMRRSDVSKDRSDPDSPSGLVPQYRAILEDWLGEVLGKGRD
jgi:pimeloyl-ACP methyl ester carboxylesterase